MQVRQAFTTRQQSDREDWMQYWDALEWLRSQGFPEDPSQPSVTKSYSASLKAFAIPTCEENYPLFTHPKPLLANLLR